MKKLLAALLMSMVLASTGVFANSITGSFTGVNDEEQRGIASGYDPYNVKPGGELFRQTSPSRITGNVVFGPRFYGSAYANYEVVESTGALGIYTKILRKFYNPEKRAFRGIQSRSKVVSERNSANKQIIPRYIGAEQLN